MKVAAKVAQQPQPIGLEAQTSNIKLNKDPAGVESLDPFAVSYVRPLGAYKPRFSSMPEGYYPSSLCDKLLLVVFLLITCIGSLGMMIGFLMWDFEIGCERFAFIWTIVMVVFVVVMFLGIYFGGNMKISTQRRMVKARLQHMKEAIKTSI